MCEPVFTPRNVCGALRLCLAPYGNEISASAVLRLTTGNEDDNAHVRRREHGAVLGEEQSEEEPERKTEGQCYGSLVCAAAPLMRVRLCDPTDCNPPGSSVRGVLQARRLEGVAVPFPRGSSRPRDRT